MIGKFRFHTGLLVIGSALILISLLLEVANRQPVDPSPVVLYQYGMVQVITGVTGLLGWLVIMAAAIVPLVRKPSRPGLCASCGAVIAEPSDLFCRYCGASLTE